MCVPDDGYVLFSVTVNDEPYTGELPADGRVPVTINFDATVKAEYREKKEAVGVAGTLSVVGGGKPSGVTLIISSADGAEKARLTTDENGGYARPYRSRPVACDLRLYRGLRRRRYAGKQRRGDGFFEA